VNWEAIGAVGEIIGALAVFITLVYLALQIKQNTRAVHSAALDSTVNTISIARQSIYENDGVARVYLKGLATPEELDELERLKFRLLVHNLMLSQSNIFAQTKFSDLPISEWQAQISIIKRVVGSPGGSWFWSEFAQEFDADFRAEIDRIMK
jgi:hypothetical protein